LRQGRVEVLWQYVQRHEDRVLSTTTKFRREHFRRAHLLDRMSDDAENARLAGNVVDLVLNFHGRSQRDGDGVGS